jgi:GNAT superfamily N-acetyltransferase
VIEGVTIRPFRDGDSVRDITALLHAAYAPLLARGMRYLATHQDEATTLRRLTRGFPFVAEKEGTLVGTITLYGPEKDSPCAWYTRDGVFKFGQYAVRPNCQRHGIGLALLERAEAEARARGASEFALDTSEKAEHLIRWYERLGFRFIQHVSWDETNYQSVVLSKSLPAHRTSAIPSAT